MTEAVSSTTPAINALDLERLPSPALVVDLDRFEQNVKAAADLLRGTGKTLRPHVKTHKTPALACMQLGDGVFGVTCATVGEAEAMAEAGIVDLLIANEIVSPEKIERIARLATAARVIIAVDSELGIELLAAAAASHVGSQIEVLVDVDVGMNRCGVRSTEELVHLTKLVLKTPRLRFAGLMGYEGRLRADAENRKGRLDRARTTLEAAKSTLEKQGIPVDVVSGAGTSTFIDSLTSPVLTELQAGTYVLMEAALDGLKLPFIDACYVLATVISRSTDGAVLDAGRKSITIDSGPPKVSLDGASVVVMNEEHTVLRTPSPPPLASRVMLTPSKVPTTFNLHDRVWLARGRTVERSVPVTARGRSD